MAGILELGDLVPEHLPIRVNRIIEESLDGPDGVKQYKTQPIVLQAYKYGPRCPVTVKSKLSQVTQRFGESIKERGYTDDAFQAYARDSFLALIPGMTFEEADLLASDDSTQNGLCVKTLQYLNYWRYAPDDNEQEAQSEGEVKAETGQTSTTQEFSPISA